MFFLLMVSVVANSQQYSVNLIPDSLLKNAKAVKRFEELKVVIKSTSRAVIKHKWAITILNEEGERYAGYVTSYSKLFALNDIDGHLFDAAGKELKSVKKKDLKDEPYDDQMSFVSDDRIKRHNFYYRSFPYTVEYEDEMEYDGIFFIPKWSPVQSEKYSVEQSRLIVETPAGFKIRYKMFNVASPAIVNNIKNTTYQWQVSNLPAIEYEAYQPDLAEVTPTVLLAPSDFEFGGYKGNMDTWQNLGKFMFSLYDGRDKLPEKIKQDVHRIADNIPEAKEKIRLLYEYMQQNTRYIGIQLGIGGWQPFEASFVAAKKYGDCKALSNYMVSILKEAGLNASHVIIEAGEGERGLWDDFPAPFFNHVVACVPNGKDTTWLECTSQTTSSGFMGSSTGNRKALMLAGGEGVVVNTPQYGIAQNQQVRKVMATINEAGDLIAEANTHFTGEQQELQHSLIYSANNEQREKYLNGALNLPTYKILQSKYKETKGALPVVDEYLKIEAPNYATISGRRLFIVPNLFNRSIKDFPLDEPRRFDVKFDNAFLDVDSINVAIPSGYTLEAKPNNVSLNTPFGKYKIEFMLKGNAIEMIRTYQRPAGRFPAAQYEQLARFFGDIYKADRSRMILIKN